MVAENQAEGPKGESLTESKGRATPGRRTGSGKKVEGVAKTSGSSGNFITRPFLAFAAYLKEVRAEIGKVSWPTRDEVISLTRIVIIVMIASAVLLGIISLFFSQVISLGLRTPIIFGVLIVFLVFAAYYLMRRSNQTTSRY
ncbi:hypothetical protein MASR2M15_18360 [Anaerolineales bacterium]